MTRGTEPRTDIKAIRAEIMEEVGENYPLLGLLVDLEQAARSQLIEEAIAGLEGLPVHTLSLGGALVPATDVLDRSAVLRVLRGLQESR
jgi:hypothetical protein